MLYIYLQLNVKSMDNSKITPLIVIKHKLIFAAFGIIISTTHALVLDCLFVHFTYFSHSKLLGFLLYYPFTLKHYNRPPENTSLDEVEYVLICNNHLNSDS